MNKAFQAVAELETHRKYLELYDFTNTEMAQEYKAKFFCKVKESGARSGRAFNDDTLRVFQEMYSDGLNAGAVIGMVIMMANLRRAGISLESLAKLLPE